MRRSLESKCRVAAKASGAGGLGWRRAVRVQLSPSAALAAGCAIAGRPTSTAAAPSSSAPFRLSGSDASLSIDATRLPAAAAIAIWITCDRQLASSEAERQREPSWWQLEVPGGSACSRPMHSCCL